jgi:hypothetical protein
MSLSPRIVYLFVTVLVLIIAGMFTFAYLKRAEIATPAPAAPEPMAPTTTVAVPFYASRIDVKHFIEGTTHTFAGTVEMPTPCDLLSAQAIVQESLPEQIVIDFSVTNNAEACAQVITPQRFKVEATASREATVRGTWQGVPIEINLIPAAPGERPEDFEVFYKG